MRGATASADGRIRAKTGLGRPGCARRHFKLAPRAVCPQKGFMEEGHIIHKVVHFSGRVQGVGFRFATVRAAREFDVAGAVRNLPDGRVRLDAVGRPDEVIAFVGELTDRMSDFIREKDEREQAPPERFDGFSIA